MEIEVARVLGLVTRAVRNFDKDGKPASAVTLTRLYDTSVDDLWDAMTNGERLPRWFAPVEGDLELGRKIPAEGQCRRHDHRLRAAEAFRRHLGIRWRRELDRSCDRGGTQRRR